jgi:hypothetical protein
MSNSHRRKSDDNSHRKYNFIINLVADSYMRNMRKAIPFRKCEELFTQEKNHSMIVHVCGP